MDYTPTPSNPIDFKFGIKLLETFEVFIFDDWEQKVFNGSTLEIP